MGLYLYCVTRPDNAPGPALAGICRAGLRSLDLEGLSVWVEPAETRPETSLETIRGHHRVVERAAEGGPVLPLRFGQWVPDPEAVETALESGRSAYETALDRVDGAVEMGLRITDPAARPAPEAAKAASHAAAGEGPRGGEGRAYLEALRERERAKTRERRRGEELARELAGDLGSLLRAERIEGPSATGDLVTMAHLLAREDLERHAEVVRAFRERHPGIRTVTSGPWPPYSFTPRETDDDEATGRNEP